MNTIAKQVASPLPRAAIQETENAITVSPVGAINALTRKATHRLENKEQDGVSYIPRRRAFYVYRCLECSRKTGRAPCYTVFPAIKEFMTPHGCPMSDQKIAKWQYASYEVS